MIMNYLLHGIGINENFKQQKIANKLSKARYAVWMIIGKNWLTNEQIYPILLNHLNNGLNIELIMQDDLLSEYENAKLQNFIDHGGEIFIINKQLQTKPIHEQFCIIDYSNVLAGKLPSTNQTKAYRGSEYINERKETLIESYIDEYLHIKNTFCSNRY